MPNRVGIDLVSVDEVRDSIRIHGDHYLERVYSESELADCRKSDSVDPERLAARFAAKEAAMKVLRARDEAVTWREIEVRRDPSGWVELALTGRAAALAAEAGIMELALSLTHESGLASAIVIAEIRESADT
jgi:holo-[acyl-carrier protein] synthase